MIVACDLHVHTTISYCGKPGATTAACLEAAEKAALASVGFANHCWAAHIPGANMFYKGQDIEHVLGIKKDLGATKTPLKVWVGCETEYIGNGVAGMDKEGAARFDFALIPANHFHMKGYTVPEDLRDQGPAAVRDLLYRRFLEVTGLGFGTGIAHPFTPLGFLDWEEEILGGITAAQYETCFKAAAQAGLSIEIHSSAINSKACLNAEGFSTLYIDMLTAAREAGCHFHFASDAHHPALMTGYDRLGLLADRCGITDDMILHL